MSRAESADHLDHLPATLVRARVGRSQKKLHRQNPDSEDPRPACTRAQDDREYGHVAPAVYPDIEERLCQNPGCFGGEQA